MNFEAKSEYDSIANYKVLQSVFDKLQIPKHVEVNRLIKARPLDNLEFLQWMKHYYDTHTGAGGCPYDPQERRQLAKGGANLKKRACERVAAALRGLTRNSAGPASATLPARPAAAPRAAAAPPSPAAARPAAAVPKEAPPAAHSAAAAQLKALSEQLSKLKVDIERTSMEREFYFDKLQEVELLCQRPVFAGNPMVRVVEKILYAADGNLDIEAEVRAVTAEMLAASREQPMHSMLDSPGASPEGGVPLGSLTAADWGRVMGESPVAVPLCASPLTCVEELPVRSPLAENRALSLPANFESRLPLPMSPRLGA